MPRLADRRHELELVERAAETCTNCPLYQNATQTVFGSGPPGAPLMLVGEQPGDKEDLEGEPFVGPAGRLLDRALEDAGIDRAGVYLTNAVKHFKWRPAGKVRLHKKPNAAEVQACRPWLEQEITLVAPRLVVLLGATAAQSVLGKSFRVTQHRGELVEWPYEPLAMATIHPSAVLRARDDRAAMLQSLVDDLGTARAAIAR
jgi:DNA polymerase